LPNENEIDENVTETEGQEPEGNEVEPETEDESTDEGEKVDNLPEWAQKIIKDLRTENASRRTKVNTLQEQLSTAKTPEEFATVTTTFNATVLDLERELVTVSFNLPPELAERLQGSTREELEADAKKLQKFAPVKKSRTVSGGLDPADDASDSDIQAAIDSVLRRGHLF